MIRARLAQLVEQSVYTGKVAGSSPASRTTQNRLRPIFCLYTKIAAHVGTHEAITELNFLLFLFSFDDICKIDDDAGSNVIVFFLDTKLGNK